VSAVVHRGIASSLCHCSAITITTPAEMPHQELSDEVLEQAAPLIELARLKARRLDLDVALWHALIAA
jgi:hypothetical protein